MKKILICGLALLMMLSATACTKLIPDAVQEIIVETIRDGLETSISEATQEAGPETTPVDTEIDIEIQLDAADFVILRSDNGTKTGIYEYKNGLKSKVSYYNNITHELSSYDTFAYDKNGNLIEWTKYTDDGEFEDQVLYEYDDSGKLYRQTELYAVDKIWAIFEYHYNENGCISEKVVLDEEDYEITQTVVYTYDENGHLIRHESYDKFDSLSYRTEFICDDMGNVIHEETYFASSPEQADHVYDYTYVYNEHGQIIKENNITYEYGPMP